MKLRIIIVLFALAFFSFSASNSQAVMYRVNFAAWTQAQTGQPNYLYVFLEVFDDQLAHPPDFVQEIKITAPDGSTFYLDPSINWLPWDKAFWQRFGDADFVGEVIPGGEYKVRVAPKVGSAITETDSVNASSFLAPPVITYPTEGLTDVPETPTFKWGAVTGATSYRIKLINLDWREPVYYAYPPVRDKLTDFARYTVPPGDLKPNTNYSLQIEARAGSQDMDKKSRSAFINFRTGAW